jgi:hypothetical protein
MKYDDPWPHIIVDDFLDQEDLDNLLVEADNILDLAGVPEDRHQLLVNFDYKTKKSSISLRVGQKINVEYSSEEIANIPSKYKDKLVKLYRSLTGKVPNYKQVLMELMICNRQFSYKIHDEIPQKVLSTVTYLSKDDNHGTTMYRSKEDDYSNPVKTVDWKQNRCFVFAGQKDKTWHAFGSNGENTRITLNIFLSNGV